MDGAEVVIDIWPWVKPYIEIEAQDENTVKGVVQKLAFDWEKAVFGSVMRAYEVEYPVILQTGAQISDISEVKFGAKAPRILLK